MVMLRNRASFERSGYIIFICLLLLLPQSALCGMHSIWMLAAALLQGRTIIHGDRLMEGLTILRRGSLVHISASYAAPARPLGLAARSNVSRAHDKNAFVHALLFLYERGFSFFSFQRALRPTPETLTTLKRTPGISPLALPLRPKPERRTSSFSSTKFRQPSLGTALDVSRPFVDR